MPCVPSDVIRNSHTTTEMVRNEIFHFHYVVNKAFTFDVLHANNVLCSLLSRVLRHLFLNKGNACNSPMLGEPICGQTPLVFYEQTTFCWVTK